MKKRDLHLTLPAVISAGSFFGLALVVSLTDPVDQVTSVLLFFSLLLVCLMSTGYLLTYLLRHRVGAKARQRIIIISAIIVLCLMFRSAGSLNVVDIVVISLLAVGLLFYSARR